LGKKKVAVGVLFEKLIWGGLVGEGNQKGRTLVAARPGQRMGGEKKIGESGTRPLEEKRYLRKGER